MNLSDRIRGYRVEDIEYLETVLAEVPWPDLFQTLHQLLCSASFDDFAKANSFICDSICRTTKKIQFKQQFFDLGLATDYVQKTIARNYFIRSTAVGTLSTYFYDWWPEGDKVSALVFFERNDPVLLAAMGKHLMRHHRWEDWSLPKRLVESPDYLVRWSITEIMEPVINFPLPQDEILSQIESCLAVLRLDAHDLVRAEAEFLSLLVENYQKMLTLPKLEKRKLSRAMNKTTPKLRFNFLRDFAGTQLHALGKDDFTMPELHEFVEGFRKFK